MCLRRWRARPRSCMLEDAALAAYPNSRARAGDAEHFVIRKGSDDDSSGTQSRQLTGPRTRASHRTRRDSLTGRRRLGIQGNARAPRPF